MFLQSIEGRIHRIGLEWIYLFCALCFGVLICIVRPPYWVPDELAHFGRAWQISEGNLLSPSKTVEEICIANGINPFGRSWLKDTSIPSYIKKERWFFSDVPISMVPPEYVLQAEDKLGVHFYTWEKKMRWAQQELSGNGVQASIAIPNTGQYSPLTYFPQSIGAIVARMVGGGVGLTYYLMCFCGMMFTIICIFFSMRLLPEKKLLIFMLVMMPTFLAEMSSTSADAVLYGVCFLAISWLISIRNKTNPCSACEIVGMMLLAIGLGLLKSVYGAIMLLYFMMPWQRMRSRLRFYFFGACLLCFEIIVSNIWLHFGVYSQGIALFTAAAAGIENVNMVAQVSFVLAHPWETLKTIVWTICFGQWGPATFLCGGLSNIGLQGWMYGIYLVMILASAICGDLALCLRHRVVMLTAFLITFLGIFLINYVMWTPVGGQTVEGVWGRYFIPVALLLFGSMSVPITVKHEKMIAVAGGLFSVGATVWTSYSAFY